MKTIYSKIDAVKANIGKLSKDTNNPFFKSKYADINQILELTDPLLRENGLMVLQPIIEGHLVTQVIELETGDMITSSLELPKLPDPQKVGSAITYFRRYSLKALLNLQEEDDDANKASGKAKETTPPADNRPALTEKMYLQAIQKIKAGDKTILDKTIKAFKLTETQLLTLKAA